MKVFKRVILAVVGFALVLIITATLIFFNELRSLASLQKLDDYPMYRMTYCGDYGFDEFLKTGADNDDDIEAFVTNRLLKGLPVDLGVTGGGCTAFMAGTSDGDVIFGRNFDFEYAPSLQVFTSPDEGYASVSTVDLSYAGYSSNNLPAEGISVNGFLTLIAPYLPFDGMNEKGVSIAILSVPEAQQPQDDDKVTLNTTTTVRLVLDKAGSVDEAVNLLRQYNLYFSADEKCHFLIADSTGASVIVEYLGGELLTVEPDTDYQIASGFVMYNALTSLRPNMFDGRYDAVKACIEKNGGTLSEDDAVTLLAQIGMRSGNSDKLQWSVVYNLTNLDGCIFAHRNTENVMDFKLE